MLFEVSLQAEQRSYGEMFSIALLDPTAETPSILSGGSSKAALASRYNVYRNNVTVSLIEALAATYPAIQRLTGPDFFRAMARSHIRHSPPTSPLLFEHGCDFPAFIEQYEYAHAVPWLADIARIERAWLDAYHAADARPLQPATLASFPSDRLADLVLTPHPATRVVKLNHPAVSFFSAYRNEPSGDTPNVERGEAAAEDALITRPDLEVVVRHLPLGHASFIEALIAGHPLGDAANTALSASEDFELATAIAGLLQAGAFCDARVGDHSCSP